MSTRLRVLAALAAILLFSRTLDARSLFAWGLAGYGLTFLVKDASIIARPRTWLMDRVPGLEGLLACSFCTGFHVGWVLALGVYAGYRQPLTPMMSLLGPYLTTGWAWFFRTLGAIWLDGLWFATTAYLLDTLALWLEAETDPQD